MLSLFFCLQLTYRLGMHSPLTYCMCRSHEYFANSFGGEIDAKHLFFSHTVVIGRQLFRHAPFNLRASNKREAVVTSSKFDRKERERVNLAYFIGTHTLHHACVRLSPCGDRDVDNLATDRRIRWKSEKKGFAINGKREVLSIREDFHSGAAPYLLQSPLSALKTSLLRAGQISSLTHTNILSTTSGINKENILSLYWGAAVAERLACSPPTYANRVQSTAGSLPDFRTWESCRTMPLVGSPVSSVLSFLPCSIPQSPSSALKTSLLRAAQISSLTHFSLIRARVDRQERSRRQEQHGRRSIDEASSPSALLPRACNVCTPSDNTPISLPFPYHERSVTATRHTTTAVEDVTAPASRTLAFRALRLEVMAYLVRVLVSPLSLPRLSATNTHAQQARPRLTTDCGVCLSVPVPADMAARAQGRISFRTTGAGAEGINDKLRAVRPAVHIPRRHATRKNQSAPRFVRTSELSELRPNSLLHSRHCNITHKYLRQHTFDDSVAVMGCRREERQKAEKGASSVPEGVNLAWCMRITRVARRLRAARPAPQAISVLLLTSFVIRTPVNTPVVADDKIDVKHVYTEVDFAIGSQFIRHALDDSEQTSKETTSQCHTATCEVTLATLWDSSQLRRNARAGGGGEREISEKIRRPATSVGIIPTFENPGAVSPGIEPRSPRWSSAYWSLSCVFIGCCPAPGSYGVRKVFPCKSAIGSVACRAVLINCDPIAKKTQRAHIAANQRVIENHNAIGCSIQFGVYSHLVFQIAHAPPSRISPQTLRITSQKLNGIKLFSSEVLPRRCAAERRRRRSPLEMACAEGEFEVGRDEARELGRHFFVASHSSCYRGRGGLAVRLLAYHQGEPGSIPGRAVRCRWSCGFSRGSLAKQQSVFPCMTFRREGSEIDPLAGDLGRSFVCVCVCACKFAVKGIVKVALWRERVCSAVPPQFSPCPASPQCSRVLRAPSRTVVFTRQSTPLTPRPPSSRNLLSSGLYTSQTYRAHI
ncbi:hypothetical protein PR048_000223 [Dryococelus australis]|uniref:Uncharacterized protein n=1 Tax=Dryococelus australis TaxID=614101 RepID=A0ABQ9IE77_9NEOP|nr:hypothetical protein PR048_000223 [Dryococelus australis]